MTTRAVDAGKAGTRTQRLETLLHGGVIALIVASTLNGLSFDVSVAGTEVTLRPDQMVLLFLAPTVVFASIFGQLRFQVTLFEWAVLGFVASNVAASMLFSPYRGTSLKAALLLSGYAAMYFVARQILTYRVEWLPGATRWVLGLGIAQAAYCLVALTLYSSDYVIGGLQIGHLREGSVAIKGTFWEANLLGSYLALIAILLTIRYVLSTERGGGWIHLLGLFVTTLALPLTVTRAAGLALALGVLAVAVLVWVFRREIVAWRARAARIAITLGAVLLLTVTAMDDLVSALSGYPNLLLERWTPIALRVGEADSLGAVPLGDRIDGARIEPARPAVEADVTRASRSSVEGRVDAWALALEHWQERPVLGHGTLAGNGIVKDGWWYSSLIQALYDTGVVGFFVVLWLHIGAIVLPAWAWLRTRQGPMSANLLGFGAGNAVLAFSSQFSNFLFVGFPWIFLGLTMALVQASRTPRPSAGTHVTA